MATTTNSSNCRFKSSYLFRAWVFSIVLILFGAFSPDFFAAEVNKPAANPPPGKTEVDKPAAKTPPVKTTEEAKFEEIALQTGDNVQIIISYYPGARGKETVPVVLLHGWKHNRTDFTKDMAPFLQARGFAVIAVDLRGHGDSTRLRTLRGKDEILDAALLAPNQFPLMVIQDMKAVKNFLWEKNNAGELNLDKLCIIGAEMGASIALEFAWFDAGEQDANPVLRPEYKVGRFVKALVLISPEISFKGISMRHALQNPAVRNDISMLILVGKGDSRALGEAKRVYSLFEREHPKPDPEKKAEQQTLFFNALDAKLQGADLFAEKNLKTDEIIAAFLNLRLVKSDVSKTWSWKERKLPHR